MLELPGWDRDRLRTAAPADVAAARLKVFVEKLDGLLTRDIPGEIDDLRIADSKDAKAVERYAHMQRLRGIEALKELARDQARVREALGMDPVTHG